MATVTISAIVQLRGVQQSFTRGRIGNARAARGAEFMKAALTAQRTTEWLLLAGSLHDAKVTSDASWGEFNRGLTLVQGNGVDESVVGIGAQLAEAAANYRTIEEKVLQTNSLTLQPSTQSTIQNVLEPKIAELRSIAETLETTATEASNRDGESAREAAETVIRRSGWVTVIGIVLALLLGEWLVRVAVLPLKELVRRAEMIEKGDLSPQPQMDRHDEIGALSQAIERMTESIRDARAMALKRLHRAEQMSDAALEHLYDPVVVLDAKGKIAHLNQAAEDLLGKIEEGAKVPISEHISDRRLAAALTRVAGSQAISASEDESASIALPLRGEVKTFRLRATPMKDDDEVALGTVVVLEDVTHFRKIDRLKNEFIGVASHELRTPVSSLLLSAQLLKDGAVGELTPAQKEIVEIQLQDLERLEKLMRDLLDVTKLGAGMMPLRLELTPVNDVVSSIVNSMQSVAAQQGVQLQAVTSEGMGDVVLDRSKIGRVLTNLAANAVRHSNVGSIVKIGAHSSPNDVTFYVEDYGQGIPSEYRDRIFDRFVQVPGATQGGAGLGLSIAQNIVKAHLGSMGVESEVGKGSVFHFTLPRRPPDQSSEGSNAGVLNGEIENREDRNQEIWGDQIREGLVKEKTA
jgi:PAS domain S-box-containing protein